MNPLNRNGRRRANRLSLSVGGACHTFLMTSTIEGVFVDLSGSLARSDISARPFAELSDDQSENTHRAIAHHLREVTTAYALSAANVASRSDWTLGREGRARKKGCLLYTSPSPRDGLLSRMPSS